MACLIEGLEVLVLLGHGVHVAQHPDWVSFGVLFVAGVLAVFTRRVPRRQASAKASGCDE